MHIAFLNIHGNFDPQDRYWTEHPDFGGQLVYVKEVTLALGRLGHRVDILTRRIRDPAWHGFESDIDAYPGEPTVRIVRLPCGGDGFLRKQDLWPYIGAEWVPNIMAFYEREGALPDIATAHYGDAGLAAALWHARGGPRFTFTAHSLGAHKLERLLVQNHTDLDSLDAEFYFTRRIAAERVAINHAERIVVSSEQERRDQYSHVSYRDAAATDDSDRFGVVPPGVNLRIFDTGGHAAEDDRIAERIGEAIAGEITSERRGLPVVVCSSRLEPKKNHMGLVLAFAHSRDLQAAANLLLLVRGLKDIRSTTDLPDQERSIMDEIVTTCDAAKLWGKICNCSLESQAELAAAYRHLARRRSAFALTALYEPFGLAPLEAMATGLPACVTRCGGPSETLQDAKTGQEYGVLVDPTEPGDIARGLLRLVGPDNEWERFRDAGRQRVLDRYIWDTTAQGYLALLESIIETKAPARRLFPIPAYFTDPRPENDLGVQSLTQMF